MLLNDTDKKHRESLLDNKYMMNQLSCRKLKTKIFENESTLDCIKHTQQSNSTEVSKKLCEKSEELETIIKSHDQEKIELARHFLKSEQVTLSE